MGRGEKSAKCPPKEVLEQYCDGVLPKTITLVVQLHIVDCTACLGIVEEKALQKAEEAFYDPNYVPRVVGTACYPSEELFNWFDEHMRSGGKAE